jgi:type I restriction enzyme S subunit
MGSEPQTSRWRSVPFAEAIDFQEGPGILAEEFRVSGVPLIRLSGLERGARVLHGCDYLDEGRVEQRWSHFRVEEGDVLLSTSASLGRVAIVDRAAVGAIPYTGIIRMRPRTPALLPEFIPFLLRSRHFQVQVEAMGQGSVIRHFGPTHLRRMDVVLPPVLEQAAIARILGALDDKIDLNRRTNETLEAMARALFQSWFVDFDPVRAKAAGRAPAGMDGETAALFPSRLTQSADAGEFPQGWKVAPLENVAEVVVGQSPPGATYNERGEGTPLINGPAQYGALFPTKTLWTTSTRLKLSAAGDLIFCVRGSTTGRRVRADGVYALGRGVCAIRSKSTWGQPFVELGVQADLGRMLAKTTGSVFPNLSATDILAHPFVVAPEPIMRAFGRATAPLLERIGASECASTSFAALRDTLLPKLLSGELSVAEAETTVGRAR